MRIRYEAAKETLDLVAFVLVTPDLIGTERLEEFSQFFRHLYTLIGLNDRTVDDLGTEGFEAGMIIFLMTLMAWYGPKFRFRFLAHWFLASLFALLLTKVLTQFATYFQGTPLPRLMLLLGALVFFANRVMAIYMASRSESSPTTISSLPQDVA